LHHRPVPERRPALGADPEHGGLGPDFRRGGPVAGAPRPLPAVTKSGDGAPGPAGWRDDRPEPRPTFRLGPALRTCGCGRISANLRPQPHVRRRIHLKAPPTPPPLHTPTAAAPTHRCSYRLPHRVRSEAQCQRTLTPPSARNRPTPALPLGAFRLGDGRHLAGLPVLPDHLTS